MTGQGEFKILGLAGSIRKASVSKAILRAIAEAAMPRAQVTIFDLADIPVYNQDLEADLPMSVRALREAVSVSDGLVIVSPEYNHGMSGVIKNAIDWVSRPGYASVLVDKGVAIYTTSESPLGGARAQGDLHKMFLSCLSRIAPGREVSIGNTQKTVVEGKLVDETQLRRAMTLFDALLAEIAMVQGRR